MIRPSQLQIAEACGFAPHLAEKYPEKTDAADRGTKIHEEIAELLRGNHPEASPEAHAAVDWVTSRITGSWAVEQEVKLMDPETLTVITSGTPDLVAGPDGEGCSVVVDYKTGRPENVSPPDDNLQLIAYGLATCKGYPFKVCLVFLDGTEASPVWSRTFQPAEHWTLLDRVKRAASRESTPQVGQHCGDCYQRLYCHAYQARLRTALAAIPAKGDEVLDDARASDLSVKIKLAEDWVEAAKQIRADYVRAGGQVVVNGKRMELQQRAGRETADADAIRKAGLTQYLKTGKPFETPVWKKVTA